MLSVAYTVHINAPPDTVWPPVMGVIFRRNVRQEGEGLKAHCEGGCA